MRVSQSNYTGRMARSLNEAFGAHTSTHIHPMGSDKRKIPRRKMAQATVSYLIAVVACSVAAVITVVMQ